jgi:chemosensory pili system protein ChpA (sensor histidine kinase/response regulator)
MTDDERRRGYILMVEDDPDLRQIQSEILQSEGYDVKAAGDGIEALEVMEEEGPPTLILLDLRMPRLNGWELAGRVRDEPTWRHVPMIVVAAHYRVAEEARALGARAWLHTPVTIDALIDLVHRIHDEVRWADGHG